MRAGIVVIELACDGIALAGEQRAQRVAQRGLAAMSDMQRAGWVGRHELHQYFLLLALVG